MESVTEIWKPIHHALGYEVSNLGRVRNKNGLILKFRKIRKQCHYYQLVLSGSILKSKSGREKEHLVHRLVAEAFIENNTNHPSAQVNHINGNKLDNRSENLEWVTPSQNIQHAIKNGKLPRGGSVWRAKFTNEEAAEIRRKWGNKPAREKPTFAELGKIYGVSGSCICSIARGTKWKNL